MTTRRSFLQALVVLPVAVVTGELVTGNKLIETLPATLTVTPKRVGSGTYGAYADQYAEAYWPGYKASAAECTLGTDTTVYMTPLRVRELLNKV